MYSSFYFLHYLLLLPISLLKKRIIKPLSGLALLNSVLCKLTRHCSAVQFFFSNSQLFSQLLLADIIVLSLLFPQTRLIHEKLPCGHFIDLKVVRHSEIRETCFKLHLSTSHFLETDRGSSGNKCMKKEDDSTFYTCREITFIFSCDWYIIITGFFLFAINSMNLYLDRYLQQWQTPIFIFLM